MHIFLLFWKRQARQHQLALGLSAEWSLLGDGWIPPLFWFSGPSLHDGAVSPWSVPGGSWERESPARLQQPSLWFSGHHHCHSGLNSSTSDLQTGLSPPAVATLYRCQQFAFAISQQIFHLSADHHFKYFLSFCECLLNWSLNLI